MFRSPASVALVSLLLVVSLILPGCHPTQPFYFHDDHDLDHYLDRATEIEYHDVDQPYLVEVDQAHAPYRISRPEDLQPWYLTLEEVISIALQNCKIVRNIESLLSGSQASLIRTVYDTAIVESDADAGVEAALAAFDAQLNVIGTNNGNFLNTQDRPTTFSLGGGTNIIHQTAGGIRSELAKRSAGGTQYFARSITEYTRGNTFGGLNQAISSLWQQTLEVEVRQPLMRGRGAAVNRVPLMIARINSDISLADFEANVRNLVFDIEKEYLRLGDAYQSLDAVRSARDSAQKLHYIVSVGAAAGTRNALELAQAEQRYFAARAELEAALGDSFQGSGVSLGSSGSAGTSRGPGGGLYAIEANLRFLMGLAPTDGRIIRPIDEPTIANVEFDWRAILNEALMRSPELRRQKWIIENHEMELIAAKNKLLPQFDIGATYRWFGIGDNLINANRNGLNFPERGSTAWDVLTEGDFQESAFFMQFQMPVGFRRELAGVRNVQLKIVRERARLEDMELALSHRLTGTVRDVDTAYQLAKSRFNQWKSAQDEYSAAEALFLGGKGLLEPVLEAQDRRTRARQQYNDQVHEYNIKLAEIHFRKGSLLEYNNIYLEEGPWPQKAYWDALGLARERDASYYMDYGWSRPGVISQGPVEQHVGEIMSSEVVEGVSSPAADGVPTPAVPTDKPSATQDNKPPKATPQPRQPGPITSRPDEPVLNAPLLRAEAVESNEGAVQAASYWDDVKLEGSSRRTANPLR